MDPQTRKQIVLDLITNDLINCKLMYGLRALHIDAGVYSLYLSESIFKLMGFAHEQLGSEMYDLYARKCKEAVQVAFDEGDFEAMKALTAEIYEELEGLLRS